MKAIGERIKKERTSKGISLDKLSLLSKVSKTYLSELENGLKVNPSAEILIKISKALNIPLNFLIEGQQKEKTIEHIIPKELKELALKKDLKLSQVLQLIETASLGYYNRSKSPVEEQITTEGWEKIFDTLSEQGLI